MSNRFTQLLALAGLMLAGQASAGTIYRCDSVDGGRAYVSKKMKGANCSVVSSYTSGRRASPRVPAWVPPADGNATPASVIAGTPASANAGAPATFMGGEAAAPAPAGQGTAAGTGAAATATAAPTPRATPRSKLVQGQVYSFVKDGVRHYTSKPPKGASGATALRTIKYSFFETCYACASAPGVNFGTLRLNTTAFQSEVQAAAREFGVEEAVIRAIMHAESAYNPNALSRVGAQGLMQLMPATARRFGVANAFDPQQNIRGGVQYLAWLLKRFNGNLTLAAAGYNAGEGAVDRHKGVPPYSETRRYVERVAVLAERYRGGVAAN